MASRNLVLNSHKQLISIDEYLRGAMFTGFSDLEPSRWIDIVIRYVVERKSLEDLLRFWDQFQRCFFLALPHLDRR